MIERGIRTWLQRVLLGSLLLAAAGPPAHAASSAPDEGRAFVPRPVSQPVYAIRPPSADPDGQRHVVAAADGTSLFVETWLPEANGGHVPPARVPTVLLMTPYALGDGGGWIMHRVRDALVQRGYAYAVASMRGTGPSGGCFDAAGTKTIDDAARVIEYLGRDARWSDGNVGMYGRSYPADVQLAVAGRGDPERTKYLKAVVPVAPVGGQYEIAFFDGVPVGTGLTAGQLLFNTTPIGVAVTRPPVDAHCLAEHVAAAGDLSGDVTPFWQEREYRAGAPAARPATLLVHGLADQQPDPENFFRRLPDGTPRAAVLGWWNHADPDDPGRRVHPEWARADHTDLVTAWYDHWLKGADSGVESWPRVQVQGSDGQWRAEPEWAATGGPVGHLALGPAGALGAGHPRGSTRYVETGDPRVPVPGSRAVFETPALADRLQLTGQPVLDAWVKLSRPDAHLAARLEVIGPDGEVEQYHAVTGFRSARHLDELTDGRFAQTAGAPAPVGRPIRVPVRFDAIDLVVPAGGRLRLTVSGSVRNGYGDVFYPASTEAQAYGEAAYYFSQPSGAATEVTILHGCGHTSALRFLMPRARPDLLNVREYDEPADQPLRDEPVEEERPADGGGLATAEVCGQGPERIELLGPASP